MNQRQRRRNGHDGRTGREPPGQGRQATNAGAEMPATDVTPSTWDPERAPEPVDSPLRGLFRELTERDLPPKVRRLFDAEQSADHILGNISEDELLYRRFVLRNNVELVKGMAPPDESIWQGPRRAELDVGGINRPLTPEDVQAVREARDAAYARNTRALEGWQQETTQDQRREERVVHDRPEREGGLLSKVVG